MIFTNKLAKTLSGLALALAFSNAAQAAIIEYNYSNSDATNSITASFFLDDSLATNNLVSGTFTFNGTSYTASSTFSTGYTNASDWSNNSNTYTGYSYNLTTVNGYANLDINNYIATGNGRTTQVFNANFNNNNTAEFESLAGATGTLSVVTPSVTAAVPEPESYAMMLAGLGLLGFTARRKKISKRSQA